MNAAIIHGNQFHPSNALRKSWLLLGLIAGLLWITPNVQAQDLVEQLREALKSESGTDKELAAKQRKKILDSVVPKLKAVSQLRRAYFLKEWSYVAGDADDLREYRKRIEADLLKEIRRAAAEPDTRIAAAMLIAEVGESDQPPYSVTETKVHRKLMRILTNDVLKQIQEKDPATRQAALHALGKITPEPADRAALTDPHTAFSLIKHILQTDELGPRRLAAYALVDLVKNARAESPFLTTTERLATIQQVIRAATIGLSDNDPPIRGYCLQAIQESAKVVSGNLSDDVLFDEKNKKRIAFLPAQILAAYNAANPELRRAILDKEIKLQLSALDTLEEINRARFKVIETLQKYDVESRDNQKLLKSVGAPDPLEIILNKDLQAIAGLLDAKNDLRLRRGAIDFLEFLGTGAEPVVGKISLALTDSDRQVRWTAARSIRYFGNKEINADIVRVLAELLKEPDADLRSAAAESLGELGVLAREAIEPLVNSMATGDVENRITAINAVMRIGQSLAEQSKTQNLENVAFQRATPRLIEILNDPDERMRRAAAETLGRFGPAATSALPALRGAMRDSDPAVRLNASEAILSITPVGKKL